MRVPSRRYRRTLLWLVALTAISAGVVTSDAARRPERILVPAARDFEIPEYELAHSPFQDGERLEYEFGFGGIPAATAILEVREVEWEGQLRIQIVGWARTERWLDWIWKMRDRIETVVDPANGVPDHFLFKQSENRARIETELEFDWENGVALGTRVKNGRVRQREFPITRAYDPISAAFMFRGLALRVGDVRIAEVLNGKSRYVIHMKVTARETVEIGDQNFDAFRLEPTVRKVRKGALELHNEKLKSATIWISAEPPRQLLRVESEILWGSVYGEWQPPRSPPEPAS